MGGDTIHRTYRLEENNSIIKLLTQRRGEIVEFNYQVPLTLAQMPHKFKHHPEYQNDSL